MATPPSALRTAALAHTLRACDLFTGLASQDLETIAAFSTLKTLTKSASLFHEGDPSQGFYVVQKGAVCVYRVSPSGKEQVIHVFRQGESFAEASLASSTGYPANAKAVEPSAVVLVPKAPMLALVAQRPDLALRMLASMSQHLRVIVGLLDDLTLKDLETRLLNWLLKRLPARRETSTEDRIELPSTKRTLASELGTTSETLSRTLARLKKDRLIKVERAAITICDRAKLQERFARLIGG